MKFSGFALYLDSGKLCPTAGKSIECRKNEMRAIVRSFRQNTKRGRRAGAAKFAVRAGRQDRFRCPTGERNTHNLRSGFNAFVAVGCVQQPSSVRAHAAVGPIVRSRDKKLGPVSVNWLNKDRAVAVAVRRKNYVLAVRGPVQRSVTSLAGGKGSRSRNTHLWRRNICNENGRMPRPSHKR